MTIFCKLMFSSIFDCFAAGKNFDKRLNFKGYGLHMAMLVCSVCRFRKGLSSDAGFIHVSCNIKISIDIRFRVLLSDLYI